MVPEPESLASNIYRWIILLCVPLLVTACGDEPAEKTASSGCAAVESASIRQQAPVIVYVPTPERHSTSNQMYMMPPQTFSAEPVQQGWGLQSKKTPAPDPVWGGTQQHFKAPQNFAYQNQQNTNNSPWSMPEQSVDSVQQFQNTPRPWGPSARPALGSVVGKDRFRQQSNHYQWGVPVGGGYNGWDAGPYGSPQSGGYPVHVW